MEYYNKLRTPPENALKEIVGGRLKGKSDINPQWRIEVMTETFGCCGVGWKYQIEKMWTEQGVNGEIFAFANVLLYIKHEDKWSEPIPGTGGSMLIEKESTGLHCNDEAYKMALTDALSVAFKFLGVAADVYRGLTNSNTPKNNGSKYDSDKKNHGSIPHRTLTTIEVEQKWNGKIYKDKYVYIDKVQYEIPKEQIDKLKLNPKYKEN